MKRTVRRRRLVLFPSPFEGHLNPMLQVAILLHIRGFRITVVHTRLNPPDPANYPATFNFLTIQDDDDHDDDHDEGTGGGLLAANWGEEDHMAFLINLNARCKRPFRRLVMELMEEEPLACLIVDAQLYFTRKVSDDLRIPRIVLRTSSAASFRLFAALPALREKGLYPVNPMHQTSCSEEDAVVLEDFRITDLPNFSKSTPESVEEVLSMIVSETRASSAVIMNTFEALEKEEIQGLGNDLNLLVIPLGPLHKICPHYCPSSSSPTQDETRSCFQWLQTQRSRSILYVSQGSLACMDEKEVVETAWGLADSQQPFLWVIRPGSVRGLPDVVLPKEFEEAVGERGKILHYWAPQKEVLQHHAVGGFWTHCGWNSVLESVCAGVPMMCRPSFGDQFVNARVVSHVWKVGIQLEEEELERNTVAREIRRLMVSDEGEEMRKKAGELKLAADRCVGDGGSFQDSMEILVNRINNNSL